jgi:hypothetical protein
MQIREQYFGLKERIITLDRRDIVDACLQYLNKKYPARDMQECTKTDWYFYSDEGDITNEIKKFIFVESFKKER